MMDMRFLYTVKVLPGLEYECESPAEPEFKVGDEVIVRCDRFQDIGVIAKKWDHDGRPPEEVVDEDHPATDGEHHRGRKIEGQKRPQVIRFVTPEDHVKAEDNNRRAGDHLRIAADMASRQRLDMKFINAHCTFDRRLIIFQFTAEGRIDFRQLLRDLSDYLRMRVELRQVGVRDETAILGGIAPCGRNLCCSEFLHGFVSINVKMAKEQGLSLNPVNISGVCGRLKCCLAYENEQYREHNQEMKRQARANPPVEGGCCGNDGGKGCCRNEGGQSQEVPRDAGTPGPSGGRQRPPRSGRRQG
jgi:hypothetical protein